MTQFTPSHIEAQPLNEAVPALTIPEFIRQRMRRAPAAVAIVDGVTGREIRYGELDRLIGRCAAGLAAQGFRPADTRRPNPNGSTAAQEAP
jgi:non-ribosomal peptide synthetase component E (peptide arylation enzyme)